MHRFIKATLIMLLAVLFTLPFLAQDAAAYYYHYSTPYGNHYSQWNHNPITYTGSYHYRYSYGWSGRDYNRVYYNYHRPTYGYYGARYGGYPSWYGYNGWTRNNYMYRTYPQAWGRNYWW